FLLLTLAIFSVVDSVAQINISVERNGFDNIYVINRSAFPVTIDLKGRHYTLGSNTKENIQFDLKARNVVNSKLTASYDEDAYKRYLANCRKAYENRVSG